MDRLYTTRQVGELLGGMHRRDVLRLIHDGRLRAKKHHVRGNGTHPRLLVLASELERYIRELPDHSQQDPEPKPTRHRARLPKDCEAELAEAERRGYL